MTTHIIRVGRRPGIGLAWTALALAGCPQDTYTETKDGSEFDTAAVTGEAAFEVAHYDVGFDTTDFETVATVSLTISSAGDCISIPFMPDEAHSVQIDGVEAADVELDEDILHACDPTGSGWSVGDTVLLTVEYTMPEDTWGSGARATQVGFSSTWDDADGDPVLYLQSWVGQCHRVVPCDPTPSKFPTYSFTINHRSSEDVLCPGIVTATSTQTTCEFSMDGGPTYSTLGFMVGRNWSATSLGTWGTVDAVVYDVPSFDLVSALPASDLEGFLLWMESTFGPYPYGDELRFVSMPLYWTAFEHPGNIVMDDWLSSYDGYDREDNVRHVALHEMAHQWAGDQTTLETVYDFVWKESMAEYLSYVYEDEFISATEGDNALYFWKDRYSRYYPVPEEQPELLDYYGEVYRMGPMVLFRQLEVMFGREAVLDALQSVLGAEDALSMDELQAALETSTGVSLANYFDAWIVGTGTPPDLEAAVVITTVSGTEVQVDVSMSEPDMGCAFAVQLVGSAGETHDVRIDLGVDGASGVTEVVDPGFAVVDWNLDPYIECLVWDGTANLTTGGMPLTGKQSRLHQAILDGAVQDGPNHWQLERALVTWYLDDLRIRKTLGDTSAVLNGQNQIVGWRLDSIKPGSALPRAGFRTGDVLRKVNGNSLGTMEQLAGLAGQLRDGTDFDVEFTRDGVVRHSLFHVTND